MQINSLVPVLNCPKRACHEIENTKNASRAYIVVGNDDMCSIFFVFNGVLDSFPSLYLLVFRTCVGLFCIGALILGVIGALRPGITVSRHLIRGDDLNNDGFREELQWFIFYVTESYVALLGAYLALPEFFSFESMRLGLSKI